MSGQGTASLSAPVPSSREGLRVGRSAIGAVAAALAVACFARHGITGRALIDAFLVVVLVVLSAIDLERRLLPDRIVLPSAAIVLVLQIALFSGRTTEWLVGAAGALLFFLVAHLAYPAGLGMGDVKLGLLLGAGLGYAVAPAIFLGLLASAVAGILIVARYGLAARKRSIPLGPFLAFGAVFIVLAGDPGLF